MLKLNIHFIFVVHAVLSYTTVHAHVAPPQYHNVIPRQNLTESQKAVIFKSLAQYESEYDKNVSMIKQHYNYKPGTPNTGYNGSIVHRTRLAADYAVDLLDSGNETMAKRSFDVLRKLLSLQDVRLNSSTHGLWSYFLEEPLDKMIQPDPNWADFIGTQLLQIAINQRERLPPDLAESLDWGIIYAARFIQKRNVGPDYTNIAIMGTHVTLVTSEIYNLTDLNVYALKRLKNFSNFTKRNGAFTEYNSPTYTVVALDELGRMRMHAIESQVKALADELYYIGWKDVAQHFHLPTDQWSGPHSRSYSTLLGSDTKQFLSTSINGTWDPRLPLPIPDDLRTYFVSPLIAPRSFNKTYFVDPAGQVPNLIGTTYLHPLFTIGSINWAEMWNQRRPLVAYWGSSNRPSYLQLRFLHNFYDFADVLYYSVQNDGQVLAGLVFATDGGDMFPSQDRLKNATIKAKDLRIRFEVGGNDKKATCEIPTIPSDPIKIILNDISIQVALPTVLFSHNNQSGWNITHSSDTFNIDYILFTSNTSETIKINTLAEAAAIVAVQISTNKNSTMLPVKFTKDTLLHATWTDLCLSFPFKPDKISQLRKVPKFTCS